MPLWGLSLIAAAWLGMVVFWRAHRIWLPYYVTGAVGLTFLLVFGIGGILPLHQWTQSAAVGSLHQVASLLGIPTRVFDQDPSAILILVISQDIGWTMLQISIESSGFLEACVLVSLLAFFPGWGLRRKTLLILAGLGATAAANVARLALIAGTLHYFGKDWLLLAHAVVGRVLFLTVVVLIFWLVITVPTLQTLRRKLDREART